MEQGAEAQDLSRCAGRCDSTRRIDLGSKVALLPHWESLRLLFVYLCRTFGASMLIHPFIQIQLHPSVCDQQMEKIQHILARKHSDFLLVREIFCKLTVRRELH